MKTRKLLWCTGILCLVLLSQLVGGQVAPVALARADSNGATQPQSGSKVYLPLILGRSNGGGAGGGGGDGGGGGGDGGGGGGGSEAGSLWLPFTLGDGSLLPTYGASTAVDDQGGIHVVYAIYSGTDEQGQKPATYAYCAASCADNASWTFTRLGEAVQDARIALDANGRPRLLLFGPVDDPDWPRMRYQYASCNSGCTNRASWTITTIVTPIEPTATREYNNNHYFAMDRQGHPAFVYTDTDQNNHPGTFYVSCQVNCTNASQWTETALTTSSLFDKVSLAFSPSGQPRLAFGFFDENIDLYLAYIQCDANCTDGANWSGTTLVQIHGSAQYNLAVDSNGLPRMAVYSGSYAWDPFQDHQLYYLWCDSGCAAGSGWYFSNTGMPFNSGDGVDLALDGSNRPRMSFETAGQGLGYAWCDASCESDGAVWQSQEVESQASLADNYEVLPIHRCTVSTWFDGQRSSLALDAAGNPRIAYDAQHWWYGTEDVNGVPQPCDYQDVTVTRISIIDQP
jgi:hypothetical protein